MVKKTGYPGMKVLQFAFDPREESDYLPHNYSRNSVVYTGTHDNQTTTAWVEEIGREDRAFAKQYLNVKRNKDVPEAMVRAALSSVSDTAVIPVQDCGRPGGRSPYQHPVNVGGELEMAPEKRTVQPGTCGYIRGLTRLYGR